MMLNFTLRAYILCLALSLLLGYFQVYSQNEIAVENALTGNPPSEWDISGAGDFSIQGFATDISVDQGETIYFKIKTDASDYSIDIYRLGYYNGNGARLQGTGTITATLPQTQPVDDYDPVTGLTDCGNWTVSAYWDVPANAVSGIYIAKLTRTDTQGSSHIIFIVRDDDGNSDLLFKTADATWQAYNNYGGNSLYVDGIDVPGFNHATKVSYNRPFYTRNGDGGGGAMEDWVFNAEYPMIRWLERNGYDVSYTTDLDMDRDASAITPAIHKVLLSVGHDEYWSAAERAKWEAARDAGVHLAFFSGNEVYWKTRWEDNHRTLVCYKEGTLGENVCGGNCDPTDTWTGLWRDGCDIGTEATDACNPENSLTGQISWDGTTYSIVVPAAYKDLRFWRNTSIANLTSGQITFPYGTLGYEWDWEQYHDFYPPGRITMSESTYGSHTHKLSLYRHSSGALVFGAGTCQWSWGLDEVHDRGNEPVDQDMQQATINLFADMGVQPTTLQTGLVTATASTDVTPPASIIDSPIHGSSTPANNPITISGTASDVDGIVAGVDVSVDGGLTWKAATGRTNWTFTWTPHTEGTATILSHAFDDSGNIEASGTAPADNAIVLTITEPVAPTCPCTIWDPSAFPVNDTEQDDGDFELGVKFRSTADGYIIGLRFYKGLLNTGVHVGNLWSSTGTNLASATFINETASGWQEVLFPSPVQITAGVTYIASYSTSGYYSEDENFFGTTGVSTYYLEALENGVDGPNGVYAAQPGTFPTSTYLASNYWVDVVFVIEIGPDVTPPVVVSVSPQNNASNVPLNAILTANFNESLDVSTVNTSTVLLTGPGAVTVSGTVNCTGNIVTFEPDQSLEFNTVYTATLKGGLGYDRIKDLAENPLANDFVWTFSTQGPPPTQGPGGPILVIHSVTNPFGLYTAEILRAEGLNEFLSMDISQVTPAILNDYDVVILGECSVSSGFVTDITNWVNAGGTLIAFRPDAQLSTLLGITPAGGILSDKYLLVNTVSGPGVGIVDETIQFHSEADLYNLNGATSLATLYSDATTVTTYPAVTQNPVGSNGGKVFAFTYDLARSIVLTRQGNPAWSGQNRETNDGVIRSNDLFYGNAAGDPQPDWIDLDKVDIPQADEQMHLLTNIILQSNLHRKPLPRFWFLPSIFKAAVVMTGDDHGTGLTSSFFDDFIALSDGNTPEDVLNWTAIRSSSYMYDNTPLPNADNYESQGFEISIHVNTGCNIWTPASMEADYASQLAIFSSNFPNLNPPATHRTHCIAWSDYVTQPKVEVNYGIRLDVNYYYWPGDWILNRPGMFTGSGIPMRFADIDGSLIDCYQVTTQMTDESGQSYPLHFQELIDNATGTEGYYGVFCANFHTDRESSRTLAANLINYAKTKNVPVISAKQMLDWLDSRNNSSFESISWDVDELSFTVNAGAGALNLIGMIPVISDAGTVIGLTKDGSPVSFTTETIKGIEYAFFPATDGNYNVSYGTDDVGPVVSNIVATPAANGTATITWTTSEPADSKVDYDIVNDPLSQSEYNASLVTDHTVTLTGLIPNTTYYFRVTSVDAFANSTTEPNPPAVPLQFATPSGICAQDQITADFDLGTPDANTLVVLEGDGAVILNPTLNEEFSGTTIPTGWTSGDFNPGSTTVGGGQVTVNGTHLYSNSSFPPGSTIEFEATFNLGVFQNVGFSVDQPFNDPPWITIGQREIADGNLYARASNGTYVNIGNDLLGTPHKFRIQWNASNFEFYLDDSPTPNATINLPIAGNLYIQISDVQNTDGSLSVDWLRVAPFASTGDFTSRVFNQGAPNGWGAISWNSIEPAGTSIDISVRTGNVAIPDGTWTGWLQVTNGMVVGGGDQYLQYQASLSTTNTAFTPVLEDIEVLCGSGPDITPPVISNVVATPGLDGASATITWDTDEMANSSVVYGTDPGTLTESISDGIFTLSHSIQLTGLTSETTYYYRVTSEDIASNPTTEPVPPETLSFTTLQTTEICFLDQTSADFEAGILSGTYISITDNGEIILNPTLGEEFTATSLPTGWQAGPWGTGGIVDFNGGYVTLNYGRLGTTGTFGPGTALEFAATFTADDSENIGFANDFDFNSPWVTIGTSPAGNGIYARANGFTDIPLLSSAELGNLHTYRIDWNADNFEFYVDNSPTPAATIPLTIASNMLVLTSDFESSVNATSFTIDWIRILPYTTSGTFESRILNAGSPRTWVTASWNDNLPTGTSIDIFTRKGDTPTPDGSWTPFTQISNGGVVGGTSQYIQYRAVLETSDATFTPVFYDLEIICTDEPDITPPVITNLLANPSTDGQSATITWNTDEPANSLVEYGTDPDALTLSVSDPSLVITHNIPITGLIPATTYYYRISSEDVDNNSSTEPAPPSPPLSFTTPAQPCFSDNTSADFGSGSLTDTYISLYKDGVILKPTAASEFITLPPTSEWNSYPWTGGTSTVTSGLLSVDGARFNSEPESQGYSPGTTMEFVATFAASTFQHVGFGGGTNATGSGGIYNGEAPWAMFGTHDGTTVIKARTYDGTTNSDVIIGGSELIGSAHLYRIEWNTNSVDFYVDENLVHSETLTIPIPGTMRPAISDYNNDGTVLQVDWIHVSPYINAGSFESQIFDGSEVRQWDSIFWSTDLPAGTSVLLSQRQGDMPSPDGSWTAWSPVAASGDIVGGKSRYIQYKADFSTTDVSLTPTLEDVTIYCSDPPFIDIAIFNTACGGFEVRVKPNKEINSNLTNIQFTIKWPENTVNLTNFGSAYGVALQSTAVDNGTNYAVFASTANIPINWTADTEYTILTFSHDYTGTGYANFEIDEGAWAMSNNGVYYAELLGLDYTGSVYGNAGNVYMGRCGEFKVLLQGPYNEGGLMSTGLTGNIPLSQPYNRPPWNYNGDEVVTQMDADVLDWVLIELRDDVNTIAERKAALLLEDGQIVQYNRTNQGVHFSNTPDGSSYYIVIHHRNHMPVMTAVPTVFNGTLVNFTNQGICYGSPYAEILLETGAQDFYGMIAGDINSNGVLSYSGPGNDRGLIIARIVEEENTTNINDITYGYFDEDVLMNYDVKYIGQDNDRSILIPNLFDLTGSNLLNASYQSLIPGITTKSLDINDGPLHVFLEETADQLQVKIYSEEEIYDGVVDNVQFSLSWDVISNEDVAPVLAQWQSDFDLMPQGEPVENDGRLYLTYVSVTPVALPDSFAVLDEAVLISFSKEKGNDLTNAIWIAEDKFTKNRNGSYYISIWGKDQTGNINSGVLGVQNQEKEIILIYPNPTTTGIVYVRLNMPESSDANIQVLNLQGEEVFSDNIRVDVGVSATRIDLQHLSKGIYHVKIQIVNLEVVQKLIIL